MDSKYHGIDMIRTGKRIRVLMEENGFTASFIQECLNLSAVQAVYHWTNGRSVPSVDHLVELSELFKVSMDSIICKNEDIPRDE